MKASLVLHIYQPPLQEETVLRQVAAECYLPLIKLIKASRNHKFTLNIPLSLLELMEKYGYTDWINDVRNLYDTDRIELTGTAAYHPLLTKLPNRLVEEQILLNEYGLGYFLGSHIGFEGEPSIMIKNIDGFFPPELAVSMDLIKQLDELGYKWLISDVTALPDEFKTTHNSIYTMGDLNIRLVCRDRNISNMISFKRNTDFSDIENYILSKKNNDESFVIALDGEFFGHHFKEGIYFLDRLLDWLSSESIQLITVTNLVEDSNALNLNIVNESTWGASDEEMLAGDVYPFWENKKNKLQSKIWQLQNCIVKHYLSKEFPMYDNDLITAPIWDLNFLSTYGDQELASSLTLYVTLHKFLHSDKFWWCSRRETCDGKYLYLKEYISSSLSLVSVLKKYIKSEDTLKTCDDIINEIDTVLKNEA